MNIMNSLFSRRKGQSAIEYLMTYGWMLLVVAIVGGAIFATVQSNQEGCEAEIPMALDAQQQGFGISQFGVTDSETQVVLQNNGQNEVNVTEVSVAGETNSSLSNTVVSVGEEERIDVDDAASSDDAACTEVEVVITYSEGELEGQTLTGTLSAPLG